MTGTFDGHNVFFLDDDLNLHRVVRRILDGNGIRIYCFSDPVTCISKLRIFRCSLLITDLKMPEMDGIEVLKQVQHLAPWVPTLVISGFGDIPSAVNALKAGAVDFIEKPLNKSLFVHKIKSTLTEIDPDDKYIGEPLTQTEIKVLSLVIDGKSSKEIARLLHRSKRTIEGHRSHLMHKLRAENLLDLLKRVVAMGIIDVRTKLDLPQTT